MPCVLKHTKTAEIFTCTLINKYDLPYHGAKYWDFPDDAEREYVSFLQSRGAEPDDWNVVEIEEDELKMFNVKLNNNPARKLFVNEHGKPVVQTAAAPNQNGH